LSAAARVHSRSVPRSRKKLAKSGFAGEIAVVNPKRDAVDGFKTYPSLSSTPFVPNLIVITAPTPAIPTSSRMRVGSELAAPVVISSGLGHGEGSFGAIPPSCWFHSILPRRGPRRYRRRRPRTEARRCDACQPAARLLAARRGRGRKARQSRGRQMSSRSRRRPARPACAQAKAMRRSASGPLL
jgi:hypothetical protein